MCVQGYKCKSEYIITQMPLPHTVIDLWRLVYEHGVGTLVMLNPWDPDDEVGNACFTTQTCIWLLSTVVCISSAFLLFKLLLSVCVCVCDVELRPVLA